MRYITTKSISVIVLLSALGRSLFAAPPNTVYNELVNQGISISNGKTITLPQPSMADGLQAKDQQTVLMQVGPKIKDLFDRFVRGNPTDPFESKYASEKGDTPDASIGRRVDVYFVAKGKLKTIASEGFVKEQIAQEKGTTETESEKNAGGSSEKKSEDQDSEKDGEKKKDDKKRAENGKIEFYTDQELKDRKLSAADKDDFKERYAHGKVDLLGNVEVSGSGYAIQTQMDESVLVAFKMDSRFNKDPKYPNQYRLIKINAAGVPVLGGPKPYCAFGGYAKITKLQGAVDRVFVEYHIVFDEPHEWFNGTTALVSKLDYSYQTDIRKFRRNVVAFQQKQAGGNQPAAAPNNLPAKSAK